METDLLDRTAVDRNLLRLARKSMEGRKLIGVKFDRKKKRWYIPQEDGARHYRD